MSSMERHRLQARQTRLQREQQQEGLDAVVAAVHEVAHEQVVGLRAVAADLEQLHEVVELPMDVAACARRVALHQCAGGNALTSSCDEH